MGLIALVYLFPNMETIGGFWLVFGAGTAVAAWVNFGTPAHLLRRLSDRPRFLQSRPSGLWPSYQRHRRPRSLDRRLLRAHRVRHRRASVVARASARRAARAPGRDAALAGGSCSFGNDQGEKIAILYPRSSILGGCEYGDQRRGFLASTDFAESGGDAGAHRIVQVRVGRLRNLTRSRSVPVTAQLVFVLLLSLARQRSRDIAQSDVVRAADIRTR